MCRFTKEKNLFFIKFYTEKKECRSSSAQDGGSEKLRGEAQSGQEGSEEVWTGVRSG